MIRAFRSAWGCVAVSLLFGQNPSFGQTPPAAAPAMPAAVGPLAEYVAREDDAYAWNVRRRGVLGSGQFAELTLTSQRWHDTLWRHQLIIYKPSRVRDVDRAILLIGGGSWKDELAEPAADGADELPKEAALLAAAADKLGTPIAVVMQVPSQPLFTEQLREDAAIAYTFQQFFLTNDPTWPLLLPMVKAAVRAMDCIGEFAAEEWSLAPTKFTLTGASKRGWTTWLTSAVDPRVVCLAPMVIDMLNMPEHMRLQVSTWGKFSDQVHDYTERGLQLLLLTDRGKQLIDIIDPYACRDRITQPKFIILGTNDRYWPLDSLNEYWNGLHGEKFVTYVPNNGHGLRDFPRVVGMLAAAHRHAAGELKMPKLAWQYDETANGGRELTARSNIAPQTYRVWTAAAPTRDFREATWSATTVTAVDGEFRYTLEPPESGYRAVFGEFEFDDAVMPYYLSTNVQIIVAP